MLGLTWYESLLYNSTSQILISSQPNRWRNNFKGVYATKLVRVETSPSVKPEYSTELEQSWLILFGFRYF